MIASSPPPVTVIGRRVGTRTRRVSLRHTDPIALQVAPADVERMVRELYIARSWRAASATRFWTLLALSAVIAAGGLIADSTATVIGAMIVAPLMTPILGTALAVVLGDRSRILACAALVIGGAALVIAVGYGLASISIANDGFAGNAQIEGRISPRLIDLVVATGTGIVGAFALVRSDVADTLPGVAIAISLVPPLATVGILLSVGRGDDALGALLLFGTNVAAIIATGCVVLLAYRVRAAARAGGMLPGRVGVFTPLVIGLLLLVILGALAVGSARLAIDHWLLREARPVVGEWAIRHAWAVTDLTAQNGELRVSILGASSAATLEDLRSSLDAAGFESVPIIARVASGRQLICHSGNPCRAGISADVAGR